MKQKLIVAAAVLSVAVFSSSCGTNKKLEAAQENIDDLHEKNEQLAKNLDEMKDEAERLEKKYNSLVKDYSSYKKDCERIKDRYQDMRQSLREESKAMQRMEDKIAEAMANFRDKGVDVHIVDGVVYVSLEDDLLYKSGSSKLSDDGKNALGSLANVLNDDYPNLKVIVVGNTDDVQFKKGMDNWTLSTERANGVVRTLRDTYKVDPGRLTAAGKSKYNPVADNSTAEGRAKNRRTDIILNPDLGKIWQSSQRED